MDLSRLRPYSLNGRVPIYDLRFPLLAGASGWWSFSDLIASFRFSQIRALSELSAAEGVRPSRWGPVLSEGPTADRCRNEAANSVQMAVRKLLTKSNLLLALFAPPTLTEALTRSLSNFLNQSVNNPRKRMTEHVFRFCINC